MSKVYFTKNITPESMVELFDMLGVNLKGRVAVKIHSGESGNQNFIGPEFIKPIVLLFSHYSCMLFMLLLIIFVICMLYIMCKKGLTRKI